MEKEYELTITVYPADDAQPVQEVRTFDTKPELLAHLASRYSVREITSKPISLGRKRRNGE